jgi:hypothetical protein
MCRKSEAVIQNSPIITLRGYLKDIPGSSLLLWNIVQQNAPKDQIGNTIIKS